MSKRGFAAMDPETHKAIATRGGRACHEQGTGHEFTSEEARVAGRKGGSRHSREHMAAIGRLGAEARARKARERAAQAERRS